ncbi:MAG: hypothetical protein ACM3SR_15730 [Ignavibacteriales bacterium]
MIFFSKYNALRLFLFGWLLISILVMGSAVPAAEKQLSDAQIAKELSKENNKVIIEEFLKYELRDVNEYATKPLLKNHASLEFFIKQAERGPVKNLFFLEEQVHKLQNAQKNINSLPYSISFSSAEKKKILGLRQVADRIASYGIPLMKRDFFRVIQAAKQLADKKNKHPMELIRDPAFRDAIYRHCEPTAPSLDEAIGKLSEGELICMRLGWTLEEVTVTRLWLAFNDNWLPKEDDYMVFRKKRSEYFQKRLKRIYGEANSATPASSKSSGK